MRTTHQCNQFWFTVLWGMMAAVSVAAGAETGRVGSWGDQGDGTYKNPILNADYPDVDVEQQGDTYYMLSSKQHMSPGMVLLESKDMVNWTTIGHVWDRLDWAPEYNWDRMAGYAMGVWAGDLALHDGTWYCYFIEPRHGLYMSSSTDIRGPWSKAYQMAPTERMTTDPAVYWDDDAHQAYLICNTGTKLKSPDNRKPGNEIRIFKMSWDGRELLDDGTLVYTGTGAEAAKIYRVNGTWYLFLAEWTTTPPRDRKQIVLRSRTDSIYGPHERKVVFERGNGIERSCSQGALMRAPDGSWWYTHQLIQNIKTPFQGRPQCLEPVKWVDGWPMIGEDVDQDGIGEPVLTYKKPINGFPITAPPTDDEFDDTTLGHQWEWNHNPRDSHWSLTKRPGWLRLMAGRPVPLQKEYRLHGGSVFWRAYNTISQRIMGTTHGTAVAKLDLSGMQPGQHAGFVRFGGVSHLLGVGVDSSGQRRLFFMDDKGKETLGPVHTSNQLFIRTANTGNRAVFEYGEDGQHFQRFGPEFTLAFGRWTGDRLGFVTWNNSSETGYLDVDFFRYEYDGPKANTSTGSSR